MAQEFKKGDTADSYRVYLNDKNSAEDSSKDGVDISGYNDVKFYMRNAVTGNKKIDGKTMNVRDASKGFVEYQWDSSDVDTTGVYEVEIVVNFNDGDETFPSSGFKSLKITSDIEEA